MTMVSMGAMSLGIAIQAAALVPVASLKIERFGLYVAVDDLARSAAFYEALFGVEPEVSSETIVGFSVAGGLFSLVSKKAYRIAVPRGGSVRPYLKVGDIDAAFARAQRLFPERLERDAVTSEGAFHFFRFNDPEGNVVELFSVGPRR